MDAHDIPFSTKSHQPFGQMPLPQPFPLQKAKPLLDLIHPRAMHGRVAVGAVNFLLADSHEKVTSVKVDKRSASAKTS